MKRSFCTWNMFHVELNESCDSFNHKITKPFEQSLCRDETYTMGAALTPSPTLSSNTPAFWKSMCCLSHCSFSIFSPTSYLFSLPLSTICPILLLVTSKGIACARGMCRSLIFRGKYLFGFFHRWCQQVSIGRKEAKDIPFPRNIYSLSSLL